MPPPSAAVELLASLGAVMAARGARWYLFGAQAVVVHGAPRTTADVDVTAEIPLDESGEFVAAMRAAGFEPRVGDVDAFVRRTRVIPFSHAATGMPLDVVLAASKLEEDFLDRAVSLDVGGLEVPVISPEDLLVTKVLAGRPKDLEDVVAVVRERGDSLDLPRVRALLGELQRALDRADLLPAFERALSAAAG